MSFAYSFGISVDCWQGQSSKEAAAPHSLNMAVALSSCRGSVHAGLRTTGRRASRPAPFTAAAASRGAAKRAQRALAQQLRAAAEDAPQETEAAAEPFTMVDLEEFLEAETMNALVERDIVEGTAADPSEPQRDAVLATSEQMAVEGLFSAAAEADVEGDLVDSYFTALVEDAEGKEVGEADVVEERPVVSGVEVPDIYETMTNDEAVVARQTVHELKLSKDELANDLLPEGWAQTRIDWFTQKKNVDIPLPGYRLNLLWLQQNLAVAVDQVYARGGSAPLTEYYMWPRADAWEDLNVALSMRPWISEVDRVNLLNRLTQVINFWQSNDLPMDSEAAPADSPPRPSLDEARALFPDCSFSGASNAQI